MGLARRATPLGSVGGDTGGYEVDERKRRDEGEGEGAEEEAGRRGKKGGGCRGMRPWSRYIRAPVPAYARVFVYLCGTPENPVDERERERHGEQEGTGWKREGTE